jgi:hypothetical protein
MALAVPVVPAAARAVHQGNNSKSKTAGKVETSGFYFVVTI